MRTRILRWLGWLATIASMLFIVAALWTSAQYLGSVEWSRYIPSLLVGFVIYGISLGIQMLVYVDLVARLTGQPWGWWDIGVYSTMQLMRRIPGAPWYMAGRSLKYHERGKGGRVALVASVVEWVGMLAAASAWYIAQSSGRFDIIGLIIVPSLFLGIWNSIRWRVGKSAKWQSLSRLPAAWSVVTGGLYLAAWLLGGAILYIIADTAQTGTFSDIFSATGIWVIGGGLSILAVMVPAGLGIREVTLTLLLQPYVGLAVSIVVALLMRLVFVLGDIIWGGCFWLMARRRT